MNLFGIGTSEFIIIFILALIFLGPERLPQYVNKLGQKIREWRMMSQVFMVEWKEELAALEEARQSLVEARAALREAQGTISTEVKEVTQTVATEMNQAQRDISAQLSGAEKVVAAETAQVRDTIEKAKQGKLEASLLSSAEKSGDAVAVGAAAGATTPGEDVADDVTSLVADNTDMDVADVDVAGDDDVVSDVVALDEDDTAEIIENTIAPPVITRHPAPPPVTNLEEIDVADVQTVSDVASAVAEKIATEVATQVALKVARNMTTNMAEEVAALVLAKLADAEIGGIELVATAGKSETLESLPNQSESPELQKVVNE